METCIVSKATAFGWRCGRHVPALRHWQPLAELVGIDLTDLPRWESERNANLYEKCLDDSLGELARSSVDHPRIVEDVADMTVDEDTGEIVVPALEKA